MNCPYCKTDNAPGAIRCRSCTSWISDAPMRGEWWRARQGKMIGGVARGLSNRFGIPVAALRLLFLLSIFAGGWGVIVYLALWIAMPLEPTVPVPAAAPAAPAT
jgi:phage shock protein PspC (stress-responsive transcriptional regulator)